MKTVEFKFDVGDEVVVCVGSTIRMKGVVDGLLFDALGSKRYLTHYSDKTGQLATAWFREAQLIPNVPDDGEVVVSQQSKDATLRDAAPDLLEASRVVAERFCSVDSDDSLTCDELKWGAFVETGGTSELQTVLAKVEP